MDTYPVKIRAASPVGTTASISSSSACELAGPGGLPAASQPSGDSRR